MKDKKYRKLSEVENWKDYLMGDHENLDTEVICIHCGNVFKLGEALIDPSDNLVVCKYAPECDGSLVDFWSIKEHAVEHGISYEKALNGLRDYFGTALNYDPEDSEKSDLVTSRIKDAGQLFWLLWGLLEGDNEVIEIIKDTEGFEEDDDDNADEEELEEEDKKIKNNDNVINIAVDSKCYWYLVSSSNIVSKGTKPKEVVIKDVLSDMIRYAQMNNLKYDSEESKKELVRQYIKSLEGNCVKRMKVKRD